MTGIIFIGEIGKCPFINKYTDVLNRENVPFDIICWDKSPELDRKPGDNVISFRHKTKEQRHYLLKIKDFLLFGSFVKRVIFEKKYDKLIILTTLTGIFLYSTIIKKYKGKYIFDYRDASYEYFTIFKYMVRRIIKNSCFTCISSQGFKEILPKDYEYIVSHNFKYSDLDRKVLSFEKKSKNDKIVVSYIGILRDSSYLKLLIDIFKDDERFVLNINGGGDNYHEISEYSRNCSNIICTGSYNEAEKMMFLKQADLLCYNYPCSYNNNIALANKYYDGLIYKKPLLCNPDTYSGRLVKDNEVGISLDFSDTDFKDKLYDYYHCLCAEKYVNTAEELLQQVIEEDEIYMRHILAFVRKD